MVKEYCYYHGKKFYKDKKGYWVSTTQPTTHAQRWVWRHFYGEIPKGMDIHHINGDKSNNFISNLELVSRSDHLKKHWNEGLFDLRMRKAQLDKVRPLKWLQSEEGKKSVSEKGKQIWKDRKPKPIICQQCGKTKEYKRWARFCSKKCYMRWRWFNVLKKSNNVV